MSYTVSEILAHVDHTLLSPAATRAEILALCEDALKYRTASVCIPAAYVRDAAEYLAGRIAVCTVIGFPNGYSTTEAKCFEAQDAIARGADEIDMVINIGWLKDGRDAELRAEIAAVKAACGEKILKVIIETCLLTEEEKVRMCGIVTEAGADFIKTSTGFSTGGATFADVELMVKNVGPGVRVKAAGGISSLADAERMLSLGADRLGTSRIVKAVKTTE